MAVKAKKDMSAIEMAQGRRTAKLPRTRRRSSVEWDYHVVSIDIRCDHHLSEPVKGACSANMGSHAGKGRSTRAPSDSHKQSL